MPHLTTITIDLATELAHHRAIVESDATTWLCGSCFQEVETTPHPLLDGQMCDVHPSWQTTLEERPGRGRPPAWAKPAEPLAPLVFKVPAGRKPVLMSDKEWEALEDARRAQRRARDATRKAQAAQARLDAIRQQVSD